MEDRVWSEEAIIDDGHLNAGFTASPTTMNFAGTKKDEQVSLCAIQELLDLDDRPTFILDLDHTPNPVLIYHNGSLARLRNMGLDVGKRVVEHLLGSRAEDTRFTSFLNWASNEHLPPAVYWDIRWAAKTWREKWRIVTGVIDSEERRASISPEPSRLSRQSTDSLQPRTIHRTNYPSYRPLDVQLEEFKMRHEEDKPLLPALDEVGNSSRQQDSVVNTHDAIGPFDLTAPHPKFALSPYIQLFLQFDWASTLLGPISTWPITLRRMANYMLVDPRPSALYWGKDRVMMYNESYFIVMSQRHSLMFGKPFNIAFEDSPQVLEGFLPAFERALQTGTAFAADDSLFYLEIHGYLEETYFSISMTPFDGENGEVGFFSISMTPFDGENGEVGFYNSIFETTRQIIADRRLAFLLRVGQHIAASREPKDFWRQVTVALDEPHLDVPFALLYSAGGEINETLSASSEHGKHSNWALEGAIRVPTAFTDSWKVLGVAGGDAVEIIPNFTEILHASSHTLLRVDDGSLPESLSKAIPVMEGKHYCDAAVFVPIRSTADNVLGFLLVGINPHKRFDEDYALFIELLSRQLATAMASALLLEEEMFRTKLVSEQAEKDRASLSRKSREVVEVENRFRRMADLAPVGMFHIDTDGVLLYANNDYYTLTEHPRDVSYPMSWYSVIHPVDHPTMDVEWAKLLSGQHVSFELRLKRPFFAAEVVGGEKVEGYTWIIAAAYAEKDIDGTVVGILGCITDISRQKWAEDFQNRRRLEAIELKRQQENFIDMTSHEMRNPLSAIIQCADLIATSISTAPQDHLGNIALTNELIDSYADAAQTIVLCAQHQTRIIDDILTLSKLDSNLLVITPVEVQPTSIAETAMKMFSGELQKNDIDCEFVIHPSYSQFDVNWVKLDPSRLLQVLINLMTNAIKFTQTEAIRKITISIGACLEHPPTGDSIQYLPRGSRKDVTEDDLWGDGEVVYLTIQVQDTGRGLDDVERNFLFKRFSQATPRTHVQYGGSGLGLFISKELTEAQGGQIGVASKAGVGSTFAFYIRSRRCERPLAPLPITPQSFKKSTEQGRILTDKAIMQIHGGALPRLSAVTTTSAPASLLPTMSKVAAQDASACQKETSTLQKHVLVVEDNLVNQKVLSKQLRAAGCVVHVANHGVEALSFLENSRFWHTRTIDGTRLSVILMDLEMPVMDGLTAVKIIRSLQQEGKVVGHVPVVAVTANARSEQIQTAKAAGMDSVVTKPFRIPDLMPELEKWAKATEVELSMPIRRQSDL